MGDPAGFWIRFGAKVLDGILIGIPLSFIGALLFGSSFDVKSSNNLLMTLYEIIVPAIWAGYTVGKKICGVQIRKLDGSDPSFGTMLLRVLIGGLVYALTFGIGVIVSAFMIGLREDKRAIHDFIAGTEVLHQ